MFSVESLGASEDLCWFKKARWAPSTKLSFSDLNQNLLTSFSWPRTLHYYLQICWTLCCETPTNPETSLTVWPWAWVNTIASLCLSAISLTLHIFTNNFRLKEKCRNERYRLMITYRECAQFSTSLEKWAICKFLTFRLYLRTRLYSNRKFVMGSKEI